MQLETERLLVRKFEENDYESFIGSDGISSWYELQGKKYISKS